MMKTATPHIKRNIILILVVLLISLNVFSATYNNSYHSNKSAPTYYTNRDEIAMLPSERTLNEIEGMVSFSNQNIVLLGDAEDPFDPGADTDDPDAYNDVPIGDGLFISLLFALCYGIVLYRKSKLKCCFEEK